MGTSGFSSFASGMTSGLLSHLNTAASFLHQVIDTAVTGSDHFQVSALVLPTCTAGFGVLLHTWWTFDDKEQEEEMDEKVSRFVPWSVRFSVFTESCMVGVILES